MSDAIFMPCKEKWHVGRIGVKGAYRTRTGPRCCSVNCPSTRKKSGKRKGRMLVVTGSSAMAAAMGRGPAKLPVKGGAANEPKRASSKG